MTEWQPIDTAPQDGTEVLLFGRMYDRPVIGYYVWQIKPPFSYKGWVRGMLYAGGYDAGWDELPKPKWWAPIPSTENLT